MDLVSDFCSRINVGYERKKLSISVVKSRFIINLLVCLYTYGFVASFSVKKKEITVYLKYNRQGRPFFNKIQSVSKQSKKIYVKKNFVMQNEGWFLLSTPSGLFIDNLNVHKPVHGGEVILVVY